MQALGFAVFIVVMVLGSIVPFMVRKPLLPELISKHGGVIDQQILLTMYITGVIFVAAQLALAWAVWKYQKREKPRVKYILGHNLFEGLCAVSAGVLFIGLNLMGQRVWAEMHLLEKPKDAVVVEVVGEQYQWNFRYPGKNGKFGAVKPELINPSAGNALGIDPSDPQGEDDFVRLSLILPVDTSIVLNIRAKDVIHSFAVRELRVKQDAVPGLQTSMTFTAVKEGKFEVVCMELCGLGHYKMRSQMTVVSKEAFKAFVDSGGELPVEAKPTPPPAGGL